MNHFVWLLHEDSQLPKALHSDSCRLLLQGKHLHLFQAHQGENGEYRRFCNQALAAAGAPCWRHTQTNLMGAPCVINEKQPKAFKYPFLLFIPNTYILILPPNTYILFHIPELTLDRFG